MYSVVKYLFCVYVSNFLYEEFKCTDAKQVVFSSYQ